MRESIYRWDFESIKRTDVVSVKQTIEMVCDVFEVGEVELKAQSSKRRLVDARGALYYLMYKHLGLTLENIANIVNRTHPSVLYMIRKTEALLDVRDVALYSKVKKIEKQFFKQTI